jgi:tetratricopeptide (TPR) repeat protein
MVINADISKRMKDKSKIIELPNSLRKATTSYDEDDPHDFEEWELPAELREKADFPALLEYCKRRAKQRPDDLYSQYDLGNAFVLNGEYEKAIEFMSEHHRKHPWNTDYQHVILDALFALGKTEDDFEWLEKPIVLRMSQEIVDTCYELLKRKRKPRSVIALHMQFSMKGYLLFTEQNLLEALEKDGRFDVENSDSAFWAAVCAARKDRR